MAKRSAEQPSNSETPKGTLSGWSADKAVTKPELAPVKGFTYSETQAEHPAKTADEFNAEIF